MHPTLPFSLALAGLAPELLGLAPAVSPAPGADQGPLVRRMLDGARAAQFRAVQLSATTPGLRPRELDRSARRDLAATLRRADLTCSGLDVWIPPEHFVDPSHSDRAAASLLDAIDLAADLAALASGSVVSTRPSALGRVSVLFPAELPGDLLAAIAERARLRSVRVADHAWPVRSVTGDPDEVIGIGLDPAAILLAGAADPAAVASSAGARLVSARCSDVARGIAAGERVAPGSGRLDVLSYIVSLVTAGYTGHLIVDLRGVHPQRAPGGAAGVLSALST